MKLLFKLDMRDYDINGKAYIRPSSRCITIKNGLVGMVHSIKYDYYKFPGGGIENNESKIDALIRETREEAGLIIKRDTIKEYGYVIRKEKCDMDNYEYLIQENYYYLCEVEDKIISQTLDDYENDEGFALEYVNSDKAIYVNRYINHGPKNQVMLEREARILELLKQDNLIK